MCRNRILTRSSWVMGCVAVVLGTGCVTEPVAPAPESAPLPETTVYFYPSQGQSAEQQDRDKYECHQWAVQQSGFDPSAPNVPPHLRPTVVAGAPPPGAGIALGALAGAALGAVIAGPRDTGAGLLAGAITGAAVGGVAEASSEEARQQAAAVSASESQAAFIERRARNYRRAMTACLEGRGYNVR